ncbi:hypothetical protein J0H58_10530 [bacterium]|nr:hypothetical protein [bacterium]
MTHALKVTFAPAGWLVVGLLAATAAAGCGSGNKADVPAKFSPQPTSPPVNGGPPKKGAGDRQTGPGDKIGDS